METTLIHHNFWWWGESYMFIIENGKCIGRGSLLQERPGELYIDGLITHENYRCRGMASYCLKELEKLAREKGITTLCISVEVAKPENVSFYEKRGFVEKSRDPELIEMIKEIQDGTD